MKILTRTRGTVAISVIALMGLIGAVVALSNVAASRAADTYHSQHRVLDRDLKSAAAQGYTAQDLTPITSRLHAVDSAQETWWIPGRSGFYGQQTATVGQLRSDLKTLERQLLLKARTGLDKHVTIARSAIDQDAQLSAADSDLETLRSRLDSVAKVQGSAHTLTELRKADSQASSLANDAGALAGQLQLENLEIQKAGANLVAQTGGNIDAIRKAGNDALAGGRNDASIGAYMNKPSPFKNIADIDRAYGRMEKFAAQMSSDDVNQAAGAAAAVQRFADQAHSALMSGLPSKAILISYAGQELKAYQDGKLVQDTLVTTGRPALPTDVGPMKVLSKSSPWTMHSPWPAGSAAWYPDTVVQMVLWFTNTGEGLHDAYWQACCWGPGSQYGPNASHGCIHVPFGNEQFLFGWAEVGTPVILYPGDGTPVSNQLNQITTDDQGNPLNGPGSPKNI